MSQDQSCRQFCVLDTSNATTVQRWQTAIAQGLQYHWHIGRSRLPVAYRYENQARVAVRYWGGIPVGQLGLTTAQKTDPYVGDVRYRNTNPSQFFLYNHLNFEVQYWVTPSGTNQIIRTTVEPFSIQYNWTTSSNSNNNNNNMNPVLPVFLDNNPPQSCVTSNLHTTYALLESIPPQQLQVSSSTPILFTYDVTWVQYSSAKDPWLTRWNVFLEMDNGIPQVVQLLGLVLAVLINLILYGALLTWLMRDLSYKPVALLTDEDEYDAHPDAAAGNASLPRELLSTSDEAQYELQLWPLSSQVFQPPRTLPLVLCVVCGTGAQLLTAGSWFVLLFRTGLINQSLGANLLTPAILLYFLSSVVGGYCTTRLCCVFTGQYPSSSSSSSSSSQPSSRQLPQRILAVQLCCATAAIFPLIGIIVFHLCYDVLPYDMAPQYHVVAHSVPVLLLWIFGIFPLTILGGYVGQQWPRGPWSNFPMVVSRENYQNVTMREVDDDEHPSNRDHDGKPQWLQSRWLKYGRTVLWFLAAGLVPVIGCFVEYAYGVAGPVYMGYYSDSSAFAILSFLFFITSSGGVALLWYYKQLRHHHYAWWWSSFAVGSASGLFIFVLSLSWLAVSGKQASARTKFNYALWFAYCSLGVSLMTGSVGVLFCILFNRGLYAYLMKQRNEVATEMVEGEQGALLLNSEHTKSKASLRSSQMQQQQQQQQQPEQSLAMNTTATTQEASLSPREANDGFSWRNDAREIDDTNRFSPRFTPEDVSNFLVKPRRSQRDRSEEQEEKRPPSPRDYRKENHGFLVEDDDDTMMSV